MSKSKQQKQTELDALVRSLQGSETFMIAEFNGVPVKEMDALRRDLRGAGVELTVIKRTLLKKALAARNAEIPEIDGLKECVGVAIATTDEFAPAKMLAQFSKKNDKLSLKAGFMNGKVLSTAEARAIAALPSKKELQGMLVSMLSNTVAGFVRVLNAKAEKEAQSS